jgi:putative transcriptional regulator
MGATVAVTVRFRLQQVLADREDAMSQSELSRRSGVSMTTINAMALNKTKQVSLATLDAICDALGVEPGELLERDGKRLRRTK